MYTRFAPKDDRELREGIRGLYGELLPNLPLREPIIVSLPTYAWLSGNAINMLMIFIEALLFQDPDARSWLFIELIDYNVARELLKELSGSSENLQSKKEIDKLSSKLIFFEAIGIVDLLRIRGIKVKPSFDLLQELKEKLNAFKNPRQYLYSTRILSLNPLVETDEEQFALTTRIQTLNEILYKNLFGRIDSVGIKESSNQIMFELVKNIYQHSELPDSFASKARGFACAQVNPLPTIQSKEYPKHLVEAVLEQIRQKIPGKTWQWLAITVNDFGIGIGNKVSTFLKQRIKDKQEIPIGSYNISRQLLDNHGTMLQLAVTTDFSTKLLATPNEPFNDNLEEWRVRNTVYPLANRGYGLVYCLGFIIRMFGRMRVRSGPVEIDFFPKAEAPLQQEIWSNVEKATEELKKDAPLKIIPKKLLSSDAMFPGTQILIEIPVEVWGKGIF